LTHGEHLTFKAILMHQEFKQTHSYNLLPKGVNMLAGHSHSCLDVKDTISFSNLHVLEGEQTRFPVTSVLYCNKSRGQKWGMGLEFKASSLLRALALESHPQPFCALVIFHTVLIFFAQASLGPRSSCLAGHQWLMPVILATQDAEIRRILVRSQSRQTVLGTLSQKTLHKNRTGWNDSRWRPWVQIPEPQKKKSSYLKSTI
jgi:hypothetical protein